MSDPLNREDEEKILRVLAEVADWRHDGARWALVDALLMNIDAALTAADRTAVRRLLRDLDLYGQTRATRIGTEPSQPPPPEILERMNHLVYRLSPPDPLLRSTE